MKNIENTGANIWHASHMVNGYGRYKITLELQYKGNYQKFYFDTSDVEAIDEAKELRQYDYEAYKERLYNIVGLTDSMIEWMEEVDEDEEEKN